MNPHLYKKLHEEGLISQETLEKAAYKQNHPLISVHWELKTLLYLGVMLLSTGLGIIIYQNIDSIGHQVILAFIAFISIACFGYCIKKKEPFSKDRVKSSGPFFDYILLLGCLSMLSFLGYLQFQYQSFGNHYGLATLIPMLILFAVAYQFDHLGVLGMAITNLALWMGITVSPYSMLSGIIDNDAILYTYLLLGLILLAAGYLSDHYSFKKHFKFSYHHFGLNICFLALLAGYFNSNNPSLHFFWILGVFVLSYLLFKNALQDKSFYFLLLVILYTYIAVSTLVIQLLGLIGDLGSITLIFMYFIASAIYLISLLKKLNKKTREK